MGRTHTPKYKLEVKTPNPRRATSPMSWDVKRLGRPNEANLIKWVRSFNASLKPGGVNAHLVAGSSEAMERVTYARVSYNERDGATVVEWTAPMFEVEAF